MMKTSRVFSEMLHAYTMGAMTIDSCGGTRSTKTYSALQLLSLLSEYDKTPTVTSVVSETFPHLNKGAIRDFKKIMADDSRWDDFRWNATSNTYSFASGSIIEFFSVDKPGRVHGPARDRLFINEGQNLRWDTVLQLIIRTTGLKIIDYNPTHDFWVQEHITGQPGVHSIRSTYRDNLWLTAEQVKSIEANKKNANWWKVYGLGLFGELEGLIYRFDQVDRMPEATGLVELYGLDFGFSNDPTALLRLYADTPRKVLYIDELIYNTGLLDDELISRMKASGVPMRGAGIYADCAEPKTIRKLKLAGFNAYPSYKAKELNAQISEVQGWTLRVTKRSVNTIREFRNYTWEVDADGKLLNQPIDGFNHAMDAMRYAVFTKFVHQAQVHRGGTAGMAAGWESVGGQRK